MGRTWADGHARRWTDGDLSRVGAKAWRIAVVEDHLLQRQRTEEVLRSQRAFRVVHCSETLPQFLAWVSRRPAEERPHLLILDLMVDRGPNADAAAIRSIVKAGIRVLVLSALASPPQVREVLRCGISGVVGKRDSEQDLIAAVWSALGGREWLTPELAAAIAGDEDRPKLSEQEERALVLYASGLTLDAVADALHVKRDTAKTYLERVKAKYDAAGRPARTKVELARVAMADGYLAASHR
jgi:DNA-binding NarL/FixJ family response regulator